MGLTPGSSIDHRGTTFTQPLFNALLDALRDPSTGYPRLGDTEFGSATFHGLAGFEQATFHGDAEFRSATFHRDSRFVSATFHGNAGFREATFHGLASFEQATFHGNAEFRSATFHRDSRFASAAFNGDADFWSVPFNGLVSFEAAIFNDDADFRSATFHGLAGFEQAAFHRRAEFSSATFEENAWFYSAVFHHRACFSSAVFHHTAIFGSVSFKWHATFESATFHRDSAFNLATFQSLAAFSSASFNGSSDFGAATFQGHAEFESATFYSDAKFESVTFEREISLGPLVCAGRMVLSGAVFQGPTTLLLAAHRLECRRTRWLSTASLQLRYAIVDFGHAVFEYPLTIAAQAYLFTRRDGQVVDEPALAHAPSAGVHIATLRGVDAAHLVLADVDLSRCLFVGTVHLDQLRLEGACTFDTTPSALQWRGRWPVLHTPRRTLAEEHHWRANQPDATPGWNVALLGTGHVGPLQLAPVYRSLRKAFEDGKHEPGAADFYYGEMEMRRHADDIPRSERSLLTAYWALSGYGMRASRALGSLAATMLITVVLLMAVGLPQDTPKQHATGSMPAGGGRVTVEISKDDPRNPTGDRFTTKRFDKALNVTLNSVVFRSSGQDLTTTGTYIEMASRLVEPALLALAVLAIRGRIKR
ncbi:pentapeptide repeat-containing protein [Streptomyces sp. NPDC056460]|uniref:pentapeptide repeat-containing protein n=1 Tax=Streptomyces sp. NPDC056460 TaxID=3345825 RepID=UPI0036CBB6F1